MTDLILCPTSPTHATATNYVVVFPHDGRFHILWKMWCSSLRWALQDTAQDFKEFFDEMFPDGVQVHFMHIKSLKELEEKCATMNLAQKYDLPRLTEIRRRYHLPPWSVAADQYQNINYAD